MLTDPQLGATFAVHRGTLRERVATVVEVSHTYDGHRLVTYHVPGEGFRAYIHGIDRVV